jgi:hypothetical protein
MEHNNPKVETRVDASEQKTSILIKKQTRPRSRNQGNDQRKEKHDKKIQTIKSTKL